MAKKKTQLELLQEIADLLTPVANLAKYQIGVINQQHAEQAKRAESEMKKIED